MNWAPQRRLIVSDPKKLTYFARANLTRSGLQSMAGALSGLSGSFLDPNRYSLGVSEPSTAPSTIDNRMGMSTASSAPASAADVKTASGGSTLDTFLSTLGKGLDLATGLIGGKGPTGQEGPPQYTLPPEQGPSPWLIGGGIAAAGLVLYLVLKK